ncbi:TIGR04282 family arsenosugar biosynthesis glycosyltransferase [Flavobacterium sp.]|uniref:TIGR04282 family arsenosugar biosynthesis glycosyltransferase n=1 Tax=Flavobacterium sp. TaxID=239 RepID=UPI00286E72E7|nr:TIGR04282 family arsenosugar biosynthesis glycosyltransferase [Flavobacterium sp.]
MEGKLILIFTRNPELGKVKTRLAASIGNENALEIYKFLLNHSEKIVSQVNATRRVLYSEEINTNDIWNNQLFQKKLQFGNDLGEKMQNAFADGFIDGFKKIVIIGTDLYDLEVSDIENAFLALETHNVVIGPAEDGGYYLLGLRHIPENIFSNKKWSTASVLKDTLNDIQNLKYHLLETKNDIDTIDDIKNIPIFQKYLK